MDGRNTRGRVLSAGLLEGSILQEQIDLETLSVEDGVRRYERVVEQAIRRGDGASLKPAERLLMHWYMPMVIAIQKEIEECSQGINGTGRSIHGPVLANISPQKAAVIAIHTVISRCMENVEVGDTISSVCYAIGNGIIGEQHVDLLRSEDPDAWQTLTKKYKSLNAHRVNWWAKKHLEDANTSRRARAYVGSFLLGRLVDIASVEPYTQAISPAFEVYTVKANKSNKRPRFVKMVRLRERAIDIIDRGHEERMRMRPQYLPMIVQPYPWAQGQEGGYVKIRTPYVTKPTREQKELLRAADMSRVNAGLNAISSQPWSINKRVADVVEKWYEMGGGSLEIPRADNLPAPVVPDEIDTDPDIKKRWKRECSAIYRKNVRALQDRRFFESTLRVARMYRERSKFYYPHQFDARGRAYPIPQYLNHHGDDVRRGMLQFGDDAPSGSKGEFWTAVQAANSYGIDKVPFDARVQWVKEHATEIGRCTKDPIGEEFWKRAENPWQFLAACYALFDDDAAKRLPVQLDGSCNGLQWYAALGRDEKGARAVNLLPNAAPTSVYTDVTEIVAKRAQEERPDLLPLCDRKILKLNVMTTLYNVTEYGAKKQIRNALEEIVPDAEKRREAAKWLSDQTVLATTVVCQAAGEIMVWLESCCRMIVERLREPFRFTSPIGFPVLLKHMLYPRVRVVTKDYNMMLLDDSRGAKVNRRKQISSLPPWFIHAIDGSHMLLVMADMAEQGFARAAVHDSYWTHSTSVDPMRDILMQRFVEIAEGDPVMKLYEEVRSIYGEKLDKAKIELYEPPAKGTLCLQDCLASTYAFS